MNLLTSGFREMEYESPKLTVIPDNELKLGLGALQKIWYLLVVIMSTVSEMEPGKYHTDGMVRT
jgi:hypothetical protein